MSNRGFKIHTGVAILCVFFSALITRAQPAIFQVHDTIDTDKIITVVSENNEYHWLGTTNGVVRISKKTGNRKLYNTANSVLPCGFITSICCRQNGHVWIGTLKGIVVHDGYYLFWMNAENTKMADSQIFFIVEDKDQVIWVATRNSLLKVRHNRFKVFDIKVREVISEADGSPKFITEQNENILAYSLQ